MELASYVDYNIYILKRLCYHSSTGSVRCTGLHDVLASNSGVVKKNSHIACLRCGSCCHVDMLAYVSPDDIERWEREGRQDIIARLRSNRAMWAGDRIINKSGAKVTTCYYLDWAESSFYCQIYETRPAVCRNYVPGSSVLCPQYRRRG